MFISGEWLILIHWKYSGICKALSRGWFLSLSRCKKRSSCLWSRDTEFIFLLMSFSSRMSSSPRLTYLRVADAYLLNRTWTWGGNEQCRWYIANLLSCFPSVCPWWQGEPRVLVCHRPVCHHVPWLHPARASQERLQLAGGPHAGFPSQGNVLDDNVFSISLLNSIQAEFLPCRFYRLILTPAAFSGQVHP